MPTFFDLNMSNKDVVKLYQSRGAVATQCELCHCDLKLKDDGRVDGCRLACRNNSCRKIHAHRPQYAQGLKYELSLHHKHLFLFSLGIKQGAREIMLGLTAREVTLFDKRMHRLILTGTCFLSFIKSYLIIKVPHFRA